MKKIFTIIFLFIIIFFVSSCFLFGKSTTYPDMVEYSEEEVLSIAFEKYNLKEWIYTGTELRGETYYDEENMFQVKIYSEQYGIEFVNKDNIEKALTSFAGKNGGHDVQGIFSTFLCYVALGKCIDETFKYVYYNININKDEAIIDTIGASDYIFDVIPTEIENSLFEVDSNWTSMQLFLNKFKNLNSKFFNYSGNHLSIHKKHLYSYHDLIELEFYKENENIVYDIYYTKDENKPEDRILIYSTSKRYGVIYNYYGLDKSKYFNVSQTITQSTEQESCVTLRGYVETKDFDGTLIYSRITYDAEYQVLRDNKIIWRSPSSDVVVGELNFERGWMIDKIDGVDHSETARFILADFYIFYLKTE